MDKTKRKGVCTNFGQCEKADNHEIQEVPLGDSFVCSNPGCGKELTEIKSRPSRKIYWIASVVLVCAAIVFYLIFHEKHDKDDTVIVDSTKVSDTNIVEPHLHGDTIDNNRRKINVPRPRPPKPPKGDDENESAVEWGEYNGPKDEDGRAHGIGTVTKVTNEYKLDAVHKLNIGDRIENARFKHGELVSGTIYTRSNTSYQYNMH